MTATSPSDAPATAMMTIGELALDPPPRGRF